MSVKIPATGPSAIIEVEEIRWTVLVEAARQLRVLRKSLSEDEYLTQVRALKEFLCGYFSSDRKCMSKMHGIAPLGHMATGTGKAFKVKWGLPGGGKSSGIRMAILVECEAKKVFVVAAWLRRDDPSDAEFAEAFRNHSPPGDRKMEESRGKS